MFTLDIGRLREPAAWTMVAVAATGVLVGIARLLIGDASFGVRAAVGLSTFVSPVSAALAVGAIVLATRLEPVMARARLVTLAAAGTLAGGTLFGVISLLGAMASPLAFRDKFELLITGVPLIALAGVALMFAGASIMPVTPRQKDKPVPSEPYPAYTPPMEPAPQSSISEPVTPPFEPPFQPNLYAQQPEAQQPEPPQPVPPLPEPQQPLPPQPVLQQGVVQPIPGYEPSYGGSPMTGHSGPQFPRQGDALDPLDPNTPIPYHTPTYDSAPVDPREQQLAQAYQQAQNYQQGVDVYANSPLGHPQNLTYRTPAPIESPAIDPTAIYTPERVNPEESAGKEHVGQGADSGAHWYGADPLEH